MAALAGANLVSSRFLQGKECLWAIGIPSPKSSGSRLVATDQRFQPACKPAATSSSYRPPERTFTDSTWQPSTTVS